MLPAYLLLRTLAGCCTLASKLCLTNLLSLIGCSTFYLHNYGWYMRTITMPAPCGPGHKPCSIKYHTVQQCNTTKHMHWAFTPLAIDALTESVSKICNYSCTRLPSLNGSTTCYTAQLPASKQTHTCMPDTLSSHVLLRQCMPQRS